MNLSINNLNDNINILFNNLNIHFKNILNNDNINLADLDKIIKYMKEIKENYNSLFDILDLYINHKKNNIFVFDLLINLKYQKEQLYCLDLILKERLSMVNLEGLESSNELNKKMDCIKSLHVTIGDLFDKLENNKLYSFLQIETKINKISFRIKQINDQILSNPDISNSSELFDLYLYNYFLLNEKLYYIKHFTLGLNEVNIKNMELSLKDNINILFNKDNLLNNEYLTN